MSDVVVWVEIEGLPYAYGNASKDSTWFTPRTDTSQEFLGIRPWFTRDTMPSLPPQNLDHIEGTVSGGSLRLSIDDIDGSLTALTDLAIPDDTVCGLSEGALYCAGSGSHGELTRPPAGLTAAPVLLPCSE